MYCSVLCDVWSMNVKRKRAPAPKVFERGPRENSPQGVPEKVFHRQKCLTGLWGWYILLLYEESFFDSSCRRAWKKDEILRSKGPPPGLWETHAVLSLKGA